MKMRISALLVLFCLLSVPCWGMTVPSNSSGDQPAEQANFAGGGSLSTEETILLVVGIVCGTILIMAIL